MYTHFQSGSRSRTMSSVSRSCGQSAWVLGRGGGREGAGRRGPGGGGKRGERQRRERGVEQRDTHIHRDMSSVTFSVPQSASPPHAPTPSWTCRSLPVTNGVRCRQGWGARPVTGAENYWGKQGRGVGGDDMGAPGWRGGLCPGEGGEGGVRGEPERERQRRKTDGRGC